MYGTKIPKSLKIEFVRHSSAHRIVVAYFRYDHPRMSLKNLLVMETEFRVFLGKRWVKPALVSEMIAHIKEIGVWGYCNHRARNIKEIHYWVGSYACHTNVMEFVLHEIAHAGGFRTENLACKVAGLGAFAYGVFESRFAEMLNDKKVVSKTQDSEIGSGGKDQVNRSY